MTQADSASVVKDFFIEAVKVVNGLQTSVQLAGLALVLLAFIACIILLKINMNKAAHRRFAIIMMLVILLMFGATVLGAMVISSKGNQAASKIQTRFEEAGLAKELNQPLTLTAAPAQRGAESSTVPDSELQELANTSLLYSRTGVKGFEETTLSVARLAFREGRLEEAKSLIEASLSIGTSAEKLNDLGVIAYTEGMKSQKPEDREGYLDTAAGYFDQALQQDPNFVPAVNNLGLIHLERKEFDKSVLQFNKALSLDPAYARALNNRGLTYRRLALTKDDDAVKQELFAKSKADFETALSQEPTVPEIAYNLALLEDLNLKQPEAAVENYRKVVELDRVNITARNNLSILLQEDKNQTDPGEALRFAQEAVALKQNDSCLLDTLARAYLLNKDCDNARGTAKRAVELLGAPHMRCDEQEIQALPAQIESQCPH